MKTRTAARARARCIRLDGELDASFRRLWELLEQERERLQAAEEQAEELGDEELQKISLEQELSRAFLHRYQELTIWSMHAADSDMPIRLRGYRAAARTELEAMRKLDPEREELWSEVERLAEQSLSALRSLRRTLASLELDNQITFLENGEDLLLFTGTLRERGALGENIEQLLPSQRWAARRNR